MHTVRLTLTFFLLAVMAQCQPTIHKATLNWQASTTTGVTYNVRRGSALGGTKATVASGLSTLTYVDNNLAANTQFCYDVTASAAGLNDSTPSNEVCGTTGKDNASSPGTLTVIIN